MTPVREYEVETRVGTKATRYVDVAALDVSGTPVEFHQIGVATRTGFVARESRALNDIFEQTGIVTTRHAYKWP